MVKEKGWVEILWDGKREKKFSKEEVDRKFGKVKGIRKIPLPFQRIELLGINKKKGLPSYLDYVPEEEWPPYPKDWKNLLIWGDNKIAMSSLIEGVKINGERYNLRGKVKTIYIDPPFATGADFSFKVDMPNEWEEIADKNKIVKSPSITEEIAYRDMWGGRTPEERMSSYLSYMYERLSLMKDLLAKDGSIYVHLDYRMVHYVKLMMDELFGRENFRNEIIWCYTGPGKQLKDFPDKHDVILRYSKTEKYIFNVELIRVPYKKSSLATGKTTLTGRASEEYLFELDKRGKLPEDWWADIANLGYTHSEILDFPTQKPEALLKRIILASSNPGDIVADFFCGSGTTLSVAEKLGRRWIGCDMSKYAIHKTRKRLLDIENSKMLLMKDENKSETQYNKPSRPFYLITVANYLTEPLSNSGEAINLALNLYGVEPLKEPFRHLHGLKKPKEIIHVSHFQFPVTPQEIKESVEEFKESYFYEKGFSLTILGWDWAPDTFERARDEVKNYNFRLNLLTIPPLSKIEEILKSHRIKPRDLLKIGFVAPEEVRRYLKFIEPGVVNLDLKKDERRVEIGIEDFWVRLPHGYEKIEEEIMKMIKDASIDQSQKRSYFEPLIDYWAIDWNYDGKVFKHDFVEFRRRKRREEQKMNLKASKKYDKIGEYQIIVKITDIFGGETSKAIKVKID
jgi:adenine-specific DNA-methyltransferase